MIVADDPADLTKIPPFPGVNSILCTEVPAGIFLSKRALPF
jgi:hypothetical protein